MESDWPTPEEVIDALHVSGHLLEQEVATELKQLGLDVVTNRAFEDVDEGTSREIDVWAHYTAHHDADQKISVFAQLLVECKATSAPYVVLTRPLTSFDRTQTPSELVFPVPHFESERRRNEKGEETWREIPAFHYLDLDSAYWPWTENCRGVSLVRMDRSKGRWKADNRGTFTSLVYPLAKALRSFRSPFVTNRAYPRPEDWKTFVLFVPIVVLASRLYVVDGTSSAPIAQVSGRVRLQRELKSKSLQGLYGIDFVQRNELALFVKKTVIPFADRLAGLVKNSPSLASSTTARKPSQ